MEPDFSAKLLLTHLLFVVLCSKERSAQKIFEIGILGSLSIWTIRNIFHYITFQYISWWPPWSVPFTSVFKVTFSEVPGSIPSRVNIEVLHTFFHYIGFVVPSLFPISITLTLVTYFGIKAKYVTLTFNIYFFF